MIVQPSVIRELCPAPLLSEIIDLNRAGKVVEL